VVFYKRHTGAGRFTAGGFTLVEAVVAISLIGVGVAATLGSLTKFNSIAATSRNSTGASALIMNQIDLFQSISPFNPQPSKNQIPKDINTLPPLQPTYDMTVGTHLIGYRDSANSQVFDYCQPGLPPDQQDTWPVYREPARWKYANAAARTGASGFVASDTGQLAFQSDTQTFWRLQTTAPTWTQDLTGGIIVKGTMTCTVTDISTVSMPNTYKAVFTLGYQYIGRGPIWNPTYQPCTSRGPVGRWEYQLSMSVIRTSDI
jgi:type II secretory pathway pseudopilin PulG